MSGWRRDRHFPAAALAEALHPRRRAENGLHVETQEQQPMNAAQVLGTVVYTHRKRPGRCSCGEQLSAPTDSSFARHIGDLQTAALKVAGLAVIELPEISHKGPYDTDAGFFRQVADRMEDPSRRVSELSGSNVRRAVRQLLYLAAVAAS